MRETAVLARVAEERVRREIEKEVAKPAKTEKVGVAYRLFFDESAVLYFSVVRVVSGAVELAPETRRRTWRLLAAHRPGAITDLGPRRPARRAWVDSMRRSWTDEISPILTVDWEAVLADSAPRIALYRAGRRRIVSDEAILGGEPVFAGSRVAVRHIGGMRLKGEPVERILEDYPMLSSDDVAFAALYAEAHPLVGRPKKVRAAARR